MLISSDEFLPSDPSLFRLSDQPARGGVASTIPCIVTSIDQPCLARSQSMESAARSAAVSSDVCARFIALIGAPCPSSSGSAASRLAYSRKAACAAVAPVNDGERRRRSPLRTAIVQPFRKVARVSLQHFRNSSAIFAAFWSSSDASLRARGKKEKLELRADCFVAGRIRFEERSVHYLVERMFRVDYHLQMALAKRIVEERSFAERCRNDFVNRGWRGAVGGGGKRNAFRP